MLSGPYANVPAGEGVYGNMWENHYGIPREAAGEMNTEIARMILEGAMNFVSVPAMGHHPTFAQGGGGIHLIICNQEPLVRIPSVHLLRGEYGICSHQCLRSHESVTKVTGRGNLGSRSRRRASLLTDDFTQGRAGGLPESRADFVKGDARDDLGAQGRA